MIICADEHLNTDMRVHRRHMRVTYLQVCVHVCIHVHAKVKLQTGTHAHQQIRMWIAAHPEGLPVQDWQEDLQGAGRQAPAASSRASSSPSLRVLAPPRLRPSERPRPRVSVSATAFRACHSTGARPDDALPREVTKSTRPLTAPRSARHTRVLSNGQALREEAEGLRRSDEARLPQEGADIVFVSNAMLLEHLLDYIWNTCICTSTL